MNGQKVNVYSDYQWFAYLRQVKSDKKPTRGNKLLKKSVVVFTVEL
jgi:hypothetical protein